MEVPLRPEILHLLTAQFRVSILVLLEVPLRPGKYFANVLQRHQFQSLFCWKFLLGRADYTIWKTSEIVSILVLLEVPLRHDPLPESPRLAGSFNPCFVGSSS